MSSPWQRAASSGEPGRGRSGAYVKNGHVGGGALQRRERRQLEGGRLKQCEAAQYVTVAGTTYFRTNNGQLTRAAAKLNGKERRRLRRQVQETAASNEVAAAAAGLALEMTVDGTAE